MITMAVKVSCHCGGIIVFYVKYMTLESISGSVFVCPTYFIWHQLHSEQYIKLLLWQVPLVIMLWDLLLFKFLILSDWEIFAICAGIGSLAALVGSGSWLCNFCPYQHIFKGRWLPVSNHEFLFLQFSSGT